MTAIPIRTPRLNANDDAVKVIRFCVAPGQSIPAGASLAEVESEKAVVEVTAEEGGYVLRLDATVGEIATVGSVLLWLGRSPDDVIPESDDGATTAVRHATRAAVEATAKARKLLSAHGLDASAIGGGRLTAEDVERYIAEHGLRPAADAAEPHAKMVAVPAAGREEPLSASERAMARAVAWHGSVAVPAYLEIPIDHVAWRAHADKFAAVNKTLIDPLLALVAFRLVVTARDVPAINATLVQDRRFRYERVNLGFSVRTKSNLVMVVVRDAAAMQELEFVRALARLQRQAFANRLTADETTGATVSFTSLANAGVVRHIPVLPTNTGLIVAHSAPADDASSVIGATYDHRLLDGDTVARALKRLRAPASSES